VSWLALARRRAVVALTISMCSAMKSPIVVIDSQPQ